MKQFNLEAAKSGSPVCTNIGEPVEIIKYDYHGEHPIIAIVDQGERQVARLYDLDGKHRYRDDFLMMASVKYEGWVNVYQGEYGHFLGREIWESEDIALKHSHEGTRIATGKIEWEE